MRVRPRAAAVIALAACAGLGVFAWIALPQVDGPGSALSDPERVGPSKTPPPLVVDDPRTPGATLPAAARANASKKEADSDPAARVAPFRELAGRVTRKDTGEAVAGALVRSAEGPVVVAEPAEFRLTAEGTSVVESHGGVFTDAQGRFRAPIGRFSTQVRLRVVHPSFLTAISDAIDLSESGDDPEVAIRMQAGGLLECDFVGLEAGLPILGRLIVGGEAVERRVVELKGPRKFTLAGIPIGRVEVEIEDLHTEPDDEGGLVPPFRSYVHVSAEAPRPLSFPIRRGIAVDVRVSRAGAPVRTAYVSIWGYGGPSIHPVGSEKEGVYSFRGVPQERVEVHVRTESLADLVTSVNLTESKRAQVSVEVPSSGIRGRVRVLGRTAPPVGLLLSLYPADASSRSDLEFTAEDGTYAFGDLRPGRYRIAVAEPSPAHGRTDEAQLASVLPSEKNVEVSEGEVRSVDFDLQPAGALTVHVVDADGKGVPDAVITLMPASSTSSRDRRWNAYFRQGGLTGESGAVRLRDIANGRYIAHLDQSEYGDLHSDPVDVVAGTESDVTIRVTSAVRIRLLLEVETRQGHNAFGWYGRLRDAAGNKVETPIPHNSDAGAMALVEPGDYRLSIEGDDWKSVDRLLHVTAPSPYVVRIVLDEKE